MGQGGDFFVEPQGLVKIPLGNGLGHGLGIQLQRTCGTTVGGLFMDTQMLPGFQFLFGKHPLLPVNMGGGPFFQDHGITSSEIANREAVPRLSIAVQRIKNSKRMFPAFP